MWGVKGRKKGPLVCRTKKATLNAIVDPSAYADRHPSCDADLECDGGKYHAETMVNVSGAFVIEDVEPPTK